MSQKRKDKRWTRRLIEETIEENRNRPAHYNATKLAQTSRARQNCYKHPASVYRNCTGKNSQHPDNLYREQSQHPNSDGTPPHCTFLKQCHGTPPAPSEANLGLHMGLSNTVDIVIKPQCCFLGAKRRSWSPLMTSPGEGRRVELRDLPKIVQPCTPPITLITLITNKYEH